MNTHDLSMAIANELSKLDTEAKRLYGDSQYGDGYRDCLVDVRVQIMTLLNQSFGVPSGTDFYHASKP